MEEIKYTLFKCKSEVSTGSVYSNIPDIEFKILYKKNEWYKRIDSIKPPIGHYLVINEIDAIDEVTTQMFNVIFYSQFELRNDNINTIIQS